MEKYQAIVIIGLLYLGLLSPVLSAWYLAIVKGQNVKWRWLFPFAAPVVVYSIIGIATLILFVPFYFTALDVIPGQLEGGNEAPFWLPILEWFLIYSWYIVSVVLVVMSVWIAKYLWPHWQLRFGKNV